MSNLVVEVVLPIYNEEKELKQNTLKLYNFLLKVYGKGKFKITIANNGSTDDSSNIARQLTDDYKEVDLINLTEKGRGRAIKKAWFNSDASVLAYMDIDLSTRLESFPKIVNAILKDNYDIAIGSRLLPGSKIYGRHITREILSRGLNIIIKILFNIKFSDAQCGFKAISNRVKKILTYIKDNEWFFDSELLIVGDKSNLRIYEEPVVWVDNPGSTVRVLKTVEGDLMGLMRLFFTKPWKKIHL